MSRQARLGVVLVLNLVLVAGLVAVGLSAHSLGVLAEGADYLADAATIAVSLVAISLTRRGPGGHPNATLYAALVNSGWLLVLSLLVAAGGIDRLATGTGTVRGLPVLVVSGIAAFVMLAGALILGGDVDDLGGDVDDPGGELNMRAVLVDTAADAAAAAGVAVAGTVILATGGLCWIDPTVAIVISTVVAWHALRLVRQAANRLSKRSGPEGMRHRDPTRQGALDE